MNSPLIDRVTSLDFSPDGKLLASGGGDPSRSGELKLWNVADGTLAKDLPDAHSDTVLGIKFSPINVPIALHVEDIEAARAELESRGISFKADTLDTSVCFMAFFEDPDGNALMLHHRYAPRS